MSCHIASLDPRELRSLSTVIADRLTELIETGALKPGEHLVQTDLAAKFGVSRVAVRDALQELRQGGLAINVPLKGTIVRPVSCKATHELFAVRRVVESFAAQVACRNMTQEDFGRLDRIIEEQEELSQKQEVAQLLEKDWEFHKAIYDRTNNEPLNEIIMLLWSRIRQARSLAPLDAQWAQSWSRQSPSRHRRILAALKQGDADRAGALITEAIALAEDELVRGLRVSGWGENNGDDG